MKKIMNKYTWLQPIAGTTMFGLLTLSPLAINANMPRSGTQEQIHSLYKQMTNELIGIRKDFAGTQHRVYTLLDQVDKMYNVTKNLHQRKNDLFAQINNTSSSYQKLAAENKKLKSELATAKQKFDITFKELEKTHKQLASEQERITQRSQERRTLQKKLAQFEQDKSTKVLDEKIKEKVSKTVEAEVAAQLKNLREAQSLSLTSTSAQK